MTSSKRSLPSASTSIPYTPLPPQNVVVLVPYYRSPSFFFYLRRFLYFTFSFLTLCLLFYLLFPSDPTLQLQRIKLNNIRVNSSPQVSLDLSFSLSIKVHNRNFFSVKYNSLDVSVGYRGTELGFVSSKGGRIRARGTSYVDADLDLNGLQVVHDVFYLIEDLTKGVVPFDANTRVNGDFRLLFFSFPIKARVSCEVYVSTSNQTIVHRSCSPE